MAHMILQYTTVYYKMLSYTTIRQDGRLSWLSNLIPSSDSGAAAAKAASASANARASCAAAEESRT